VSFSSKNSVKKLPLERQSQLNVVLNIQGITPTKINLGSKKGSKFPATNKKIREKIEEYN
jgi:hypothetical protein